ncbi:hypothetical protein F4778DRAFT_65288 [Xylariomycetidae sp. FL2044]|nr:hypothetical protein F4778DRAFT_65288 [Xylariomycetidae sp. FL2044]
MMPNHPGADRLSHKILYTPQSGGYGPAHSQNGYNSGRSSISSESSARAQNEMWPYTPKAQAILRRARSMAPVYPSSNPLPQVPGPGHTTAAFATPIVQAASQGSVSATEEQQANGGKKGARGIKRQNSVEEPNRRIKTQATSTTASPAVTKPLSTYVLSPSSAAQQYYSHAALSLSEYQQACKPELPSSSHQQKRTTTTSVSLAPAEESDDELTEFTNYLQTEIARTDAEKARVESENKAKEDTQSAQQREYEKMVPWPGDSAHFPAAIFEDVTTLLRCKYRAKVINIGTPIERWWELCAMPAGESEERRKKRVEYYRTKLRVSVYAYRPPGADSIVFRLYEDGKAPEEVVARGADWSLAHTRLNTYFEGMSPEKIYLGVRHLLATVPGKNDCLSKWTRDPMSGSS